MGPNRILRRVRNGYRPREITGVSRTLEIGLSDLMVSFGTPELTICPAWEMRLLKVWLRHSQWRGKRKLEEGIMSVVYAIE
jgi:hypothetical protein